MRHYYFIAFLLILTSCTKYKLNQPCKISFSSDYFSSSGANGNGVQYSGTATISRFTFSGLRKEGSAVEIERDFEEKNLSLSANSPFDFDFDIPVGIYTQYSVKIRLSDANSLVLKKVYEDTTKTPIVIQFDEDLDLLFSSNANTKELQKKEKYNCSLIWNYDLLFAGITSQNISNASTKAYDGVESVVIDATNNADLFDKIKKNIQNSLQVKIQ